MDEDDDLNEEILSSSSNSEDEDVDEEDVDVEELLPEDEDEDNEGIDTVSSRDESLRNLDVVKKISLSPLNNPLIAYNPNIDYFDENFDIGSLPYYLRMVYKNVLFMLKDRGDRDIRVNNINSITSNNTRVEFIPKISKPLLSHKIMTDPNRREGLDIIISSGVTSSFNLNPVLKERAKRGEYIRIWSINDLRINKYEALKNINGSYENINITIVRDPAILENLENTGPIKNLPVIPSTDPLVKWFAARSGNILEFDDKTKKILYYKRVC